MKKKITVISCVIFVAAMMMFAQPAMSGKWADTPSGLDVEILLVTVSEVSEQGVILTIFGYNFDNGDFPIVTIASYPCMPFDLEPWMDGVDGRTIWRMDVLSFPFEGDANYLMTLKTGSSVHQFDTLSVYIDVP